MDMVTVRNFLEPYGVFSSMSTHAKLRKISVENYFFLFFVEASSIEHSLMQLNEAVADIAHNVRLLLDDRHS